MRQENEAPVNRAVQGQWNLAVCSRVSTKSMGRERLKRFMENDGSLARACAMDVRLLKKSGAEVVPPDYEIFGETAGTAHGMKIRIVCREPFRPKVSKILREKLSLSKKDFDGLVQNGRIRMENGGDVCRSRLEEETTVLLETVHSQKQKHTSRLGSPVGRAVRARL